MENRIVNIGFLGAGKMAASFADSLNSYNRKKGYRFCLYGVGARDVSRAEEFKNTHGFDKTYETYLDMAQDPNIDVIYINTTIAQHYEQIKMCLENNKNCFVEKAFTNNADELKELVELARSKNLYLGEAIWTRFMPYIDDIKSDIKSGLIGYVFNIQSNLGYPISHIERLQRKDLGGGAMKDVGVYPLNFSLIFADSKVRDIHVDKTYTKSDVDESEWFTLFFENGIVANNFSTMLTQTSRKGFIYGSKGYIEVFNINNPEKYEVHDEHGNLIKVVRYDDRELVGYEYEIQCLYDDLLSGYKEPRLMPLEKSIEVMELVDKILS